jgi:ABC-type antimicrobial peptide transport system permease subunit
MPGVRAAIARADADLPLTGLRTQDDRIGDALWRQRLSAAAFGVLGSAALVVALVGVLAVTSYLVGRRSHEMGVRLALGARPAAIVRLVLVETGWLVLAGTVLGLAGAFAMGQLLSTMLFGITGTDAATFTAAAAGLALAALAACYPPARRASRVDPLVTLRDNGCAP